MGVARSNSNSWFFFLWLTFGLLVRPQAERDARKLVFDNDGQFKIAQFADRESFSLAL